MKATHAEILGCEYKQDTNVIYRPSTMHPETKPNKGSSLLGIRAVVAQSYERIHRNNLVVMGVLPLIFIAIE